MFSRWPSDLDVPFNVHEALTEQCNDRNFSKLVRVRNQKFVSVEGQSNAWSFSFGPGTKFLPVSC